MRWRIPIETGIGQIGNRFRASTEVGRRVGPAHGESLSGKAIIGSAPGLVGKTTPSLDMYR
jgi:hypothetical protein